MLEDELRVNHSNALLEIAASFIFNPDQTPEERRDQLFYRCMGQKMQNFIRENLGFLQGVYTFYLPHKSLLDIWMDRRDWIGVRDPNEKEGIKKEIEEEIKEINKIFEQSAESEANWILSRFEKQKRQNSILSTFLWKLDGEMTFDSLLTSFLLKACPEGFVLKEGEEAFKHLFGQEASKTPWDFILTQLGICLNDDSVLGFGKRMERFQNWLSSDKAEMDLELYASPLIADIAKDIQNTINENEKEDVSELSSQLEKKCSYWSKKDYLIASTNLIKEQLGKDLGYNFLGHTYLRIVDVVKRHKPDLARALVGFHCTRFVSPDLKRSYESYFFGTFSKIEEIETESELDWKYLIYNIFNTFGAKISSEKLGTGMLKMETDLTQSATREDTEKALRIQHSHAMGSEIVFLAKVIGYWFNKEFLEPLDSIRKRIPQLAPDAIRGSQSRSSIKEVLDQLDGAPRVGVLKPIERIILSFLAMGRLITIDEIEEYIQKFDKILEEIFPSKILTGFEGIKNELACARKNNRALTRLESPEVRIEPVRVGKYPFVNSLTRALTVALSAYFEQAFPSSKELAAPNYEKSVEAIFGRERGKQIDDEWSRFMANYQFGHTLRYKELYDWIQQHLAQGSGGAKCLVNIKLPEPSNQVGIQEEESAGTAIFELWLQEALLNALKYMRPIDNIVTLKVSWQFDNTLKIDIYNTFDGEDVPDEEGKYGRGFLETIPKYILPGYEGKSAQQEGENEWKTSIFRKNFREV